LLIIVYNDAHFNNNYYRFTLQLPGQHEGHHAVQVRSKVGVRGRGSGFDVPVPGQPGTVLPVRHRGVSGRVRGTRLRRRVRGAVAAAAAAADQVRVRRGLAGGERHADGQHDGVRARARRDGPEPDAVRRPRRRGHPAAVAAIPVHSVRAHVPHHARHQRVPVLGDDVLVRPHRHH